MPAAFLLNPPRRRRARRRRTKARRRNRGTRAGARKAARTRARKRAARSRAARKAARTRARKGGRRRGRRRRSKNRGVIAASRPRRRRRNPSRRRRRTRARRRRNPGFAGALTGPTANVIDIRIPVPGMLGRILNNTIQTIAAGGVVFAGYMTSGVVVDAIDKATLNIEAIQGRWKRPIMFGALAGIIGGVVSMLAPAGKKGTWALLAAAGPGIRAFAGTVNNLIPDDTAPGMTADLKRAAAGLSDYLQVGDLYQAGLGDNGGHALGDYLQVGDLYQAGLGNGELTEDVTESMDAFAAY